jgi:hypothetical protein
MVAGSATEGTCARYESAQCINEIRWRLHCERDGVKIKKSGPVVHFQTVYFELFLFCEVESLMNLCKTFDISRHSYWRFAAVQEIG